MRALVLAALCVASVAGCSNLPDFNETCGNGVIDPGESCDRNDPSCQQCQQTCPTHADQECIDNVGPGYRCGANDVCHAPSGLFMQDSVRDIDFPVGGGQIADLDGDRIGDVIGYSDINVDVRFGDPNLSLDKRSNVIVPFSNLSLAVRTFPAFDDGMGNHHAEQSDMLLPTQDGLAGFTARGQSLISYPFANAPGQRGACALDPDPVTHMPRVQPVQAFSIDKHHLAFVRRRFDTGALELGVLDPANSGSDQCLVRPLCSLKTDSSIPGKYVVLYDQYDLAIQQPSTIRTSTMIAISAIPVLAVPEDQQSSTADVCLVQFTDDLGKTAGSHMDIRAIAMTAPAIGKDAFVTLARTDKTSPCPALYTPAPTMGVQVYPPSVSEPCSVGAPQAVAPWIFPGTFVTGRIPLVPPIAGYAPDAIAVTQGGTGAVGGTTDIYAFQTPLGLPGRLSLAHIARPLLQFRSADLDGDGAVEGIGVVSLPLASFFGGQADFDILYRTKGGTDSFLVYHMPTLSVPTHFDLGDFDGNGLTDIAFTERLGSEERLLVSYSTSDRPLEPVEIATFTNVGSLQRIDLPDSIDPTGEALDDLVVVDVVDPTDINLAILHGNPQRTMLAFYDPNNNLTNPTRLVGAVAGNFVADASADERVVDVTLFDDQEPTNMYVVSGIHNRQGLKDPAVKLEAPALTNQCPFGPAAGKLCLEGAKIIPWHLADRDVLIAANPPFPPTPSAPVTQERKLVLLDPSVTTTTNTGKAITAQFSPATIDTQQFTFDMVGADVYGTGQRALFLSMGSFGPFGGDPTKDHVAMCTVDANGMPQACTNILAAIPDPELADPSWRCVFAQTGRVRGEGRFDFVPETPSDDILLLCKRGTDGRVLRVSRNLDSSDPVLRAETVLSGPGVSEFEFLSVGDVNGDRVDDLVGISIDASTNIPKLHVYPQCTAEDLDCHDKAINRSPAFGAQPPEMP
jgi:hypothetical protein